jgi:hypothetical protein
MLIGKNALYSTKFCVKLVSIAKPPTSWQERKIQRTTRQPMLFPGPESRRLFFFKRTPSFVEDGIVNIKPLQLDLNNERSTDFTHGPIQRQPHTTKRLQMIELFHIGTHRHFSTDVSHLRKNALATLPELVQCRSYSLAPPLPQRHVVVTAKPRYTDTLMGERCCPSPSSNLGG